MSEGNTLDAYMLPEGASDAAGMLHRIQHECGFYICAFNVSFRILILAVLAKRWIQVLLSEWY